MVPGNKFTGLTCACFIVLFSAVIFLPGLSIVPLYGSEGRWAVIAREMLVSGDYFIQTINAQPYYNKPLISYWAILPFAWLGGQGVTEWAARMPSALSGVAMVFLTMVIGKRVFGLRTGIIAGVLLSTSFMFGLWSRRASVDMLNMLGIWLVLWCFIAGGKEGKRGHIFGMYALASFASFFKGPVAASVAFAAIFFYSAFGVISDLSRRGFEKQVFKEAFSREFRWILSKNALLMIGAGSVIFIVILFGPGMVTGDFGFVHRMWVENVVRFFKPFNHIDPFYTYIPYSMIFFLPWSFLFLASLWDSKYWPQSEGKRMALLFALAIFLFFTASGSRQSYYILPILPAFALITGNAVNRWLLGEGGRGIFMTAAFFLAVFFILVLSGALAYAYYFTSAPRFPFELAAAAVLAVGSVLALLIFRRRSFAFGMAVAVIFAAELWTFNSGVMTTANIWSTKEFGKDVSLMLTGVPDEKIALYRLRNRVPIFIFYLNRRGLEIIENPAEAAAFLSRHPDGYIFTEGAYVFKEGDKSLKNAEAVLTESYFDPFSKKDRGNDAITLVRHRPIR